MSIYTKYELWIQYIHSNSTQPQPSNSLPPFLQQIQPQIWCAKVTNLSIHHQTSCARLPQLHMPQWWVVSKQPGNARWFKMASLEVTDYPLKGHGFFTIPKSRSRIESPAYRSSCFNFIVSIVSQIFQKLQQNIIWESLTFPTKWAQSQQLKNVG